MGRMRPRSDARLGHDHHGDESALPRGTLTFMLTDIESSTKLWRSNPAAMSTAVARHEELITDAVRRFGGYLPVDHGEGDSVFSVFTRATDAIGAAGHMQQALAAESWPGGIELKVRVGLHTGEAELRGGNYYGAAVSRAARIRSLAWGGQTLMSQSTYDLVRDGLPPAFTVRDLGTYVLKDFDRPERIFELRPPGAFREFPALGSSESRPHNLPLPITTFVGREREVAELEHLLVGHRLVTVTGPGGCGKTRLALEVSRRVIDDFEDGAYVVDLASVADPTVVPITVARNLGVREGRDQAALEGLEQFLAGRSMLLLLDNFERVLPAAEMVSKLLSASPGLRVLVTSRAPLRLRGEQEVPLEPLSLPEPRRGLKAEELRSCDAIQLFVERAQAVNPRFELTDENSELVVEVCSRLDGLPLAIELAAVRLRLLPLSALAERLRTRLDLLRGGARDLPARQQTLRDLIDWDYEVLPEDERAAFRALSAFDGGFSLEAATRVLGEEDDFVVLDQLESLVSKSLLRQSPTTDEQPRFMMLQTIRERAADLLQESGEAPEVRERHATFYLSLAEKADASMRGPEQTMWLQLLEEEHPNLRAALRWAEAEGDKEAILRLCSSLANFWATRGYLSEGRRSCDAALRLSAGDRTALRAHLLSGAAMIARGQGEFDRADDLLDECVSIRRELGDEDGVASALRHLGALHYDRGDMRRARELTEQSLEIRRRLGNTLGVAQALNNLGVMAQLEGDHERAIALYEESLALFRELSDKEGIARSVMNLGAVSRDVGELDRSAALLRESMRLWLELGDAWDMTDAMEDLAGVQCELGRWEVAATLFGAAEGVRKGIGAQRNVSDQAAYERRVEAIRRELDPEKLSAAWEEGARMRVPEIVVYAEVAT